MRGRERRGGIYSTITTSNIITHFLQWLSFLIYAFYIYKQKFLGNLKIICYIICFLICVHSLASKLNKEKEIKPSKAYKTLLDEREGEHVCTEYE